MLSVIEHNIIGQSEPIIQVKKLITINAQYPAPVLITGETGTGKELVARGLHYGGVLSEKPFIAVNCSTLSDDLFVSELFGYKKGAFTDAKSDKEGLLVAASGGSIFFDEIDSLSLKSQAALLRVLQESEFRPIGSSQVIKSNVRIIAAVNCDLVKKIDLGLFRQDLYFRLFILSVKMPPLRERKEDIGLLVKHFIHKFNDVYSLNRLTICETFLKKLKSHHWPGNVRELENTIHRHYLLSSGSIITEVIPIDVTEQSMAKTHINQVNKTYNKDATNIRNHVDIPPFKEDEIESDSLNFCNAKRKAIEEFEEKFVSQILRYAKGNITKAASLCGKERRAFGKLVKKYKIRREHLSLI